MVPFTTIHLVAAASRSVIPPLGTVAPKGTVPVENFALLWLSFVDSNAERARGARRRPPRLELTASPRSSLGLSSPARWPHKPVRSWKTANTKRAVTPPIATTVAKTTTASMLLRPSRCQ